MLRIPPRLAVILVCMSAGCSGRGSSGADKPAESAPDPVPQATPDRGPAAPAAVAQARSFDDDAVDAVPSGVQILETNGSNTMATWAVVTTDDAPSGDQAFGVTHTTNKGQTYNVALFEGGPVADVALTVKIKAVTGEEDQGGGVVFRATNATDYYICRWNPLENNAKFYVVQGSHRTAIAATDLDLDPATWQTMRVVVEGSRMELFMNDESVLTLIDDTITTPGATGLWTKADAATLFDDFTSASL